MDKVASLLPGSVEVLEADRRGGVLRTSHRDICDGLRYYAIWSNDLLAALFSDLLFIVVNFFEIRDRIDAQTYKEAITAAAGAADKLQKFLENVVETRKTKSLVELKTQLFDHLEQLMYPLYVLVYRDKAIARTDTEVLRASMKSFASILERDKEELDIAEFVPGLTSLTKVIMVNYPELLKDNDLAAVLLNVLVRVNPAAVQTFLSRIAEQR